jgi:hypothetical protein
MQVVFITFLAIMAINAQDPPVTEGLLASQADLSLGHEFFEENIAESRRELSVFIENDVRQILESHMEAYGSIKTTSIETIAAIDELEVNATTERCLAAARARFDLQITRYGKNLSKCIETASRSKF